MTAVRIEDLPGGSEDLDERKLAIAFKEGDRSAYGFIYARFETRVAYLCRRMLHDRDDAAEASQETFLRVYQSLGSFNGQYKLGAWITRIATNVCLDQIRTRQRKPIEPIPLEALEIDPPIDAVEDSPEETVMRLSENRRVRRVLKQLPPMHRAAIVLRDFEGMSYSEIAGILEISDCQVKALIHRARQGFKRSWTAGLASLFVPTRLLTRVRKIDSPVRDQATSAAASHATEVANSAATLVGQCSTVVQSCGQYVTDKAAAIFTAAVVGTAAAGGGMIAGAHEPRPSPEPLLRTKVAAAPAPAPQAQAPQEEKRLKNSGSTAAPSQQVSDENETAPSTEVPEIETEVPADPVPSPTPAPEGEGGSGSGSGQTGGTTDPKPADPKPSPQPAPAPTFTAGVGWDTGSGVRISEVSSNKAVVNCGSGRVVQNLSATVSHEGANYPGRLRLESGGGVAKLELVVTADGHNYTYSSWGASPTSTFTRDGSSASIQISGSYGPRYGQHPEESGLPRSGSFTAALNIDCDRAALETETVSLKSE